MKRACIRTTYLTILLDMAYRKEGMPVHLIFARYKLTPKQYLKFYGKFAGYLQYDDGMLSLNEKTRTELFSRYFPSHSQKSDGKGIRRIPYRFAGPQIALESFCLPSGLKRSQEEPEF